MSRELKEIPSIKEDMNQKKPCDGLRWFTLCQKDVKLSKRCQKVKPMNYGGGSQKKLTWSSQILTSILMSNMNITEIGQKYFQWRFWGFLVTIICPVKIDIKSKKITYSCIYEETVSYKNSWKMPLIGRKFPNDIAS